MEPLPIPVEETPEITQETPPPQIKKTSGCFGLVGKIVFVAGLVVLGIWVSGFVRNYFPKNTQSTIETKTIVTPTPILEASSSAGWVPYEVISGVSYQLPLDVLSPICDGSGCPSKGTYLPGGTRFTVAMRGQGYQLADYRGTAIADAFGTTFITKQTTIAGLPATEFEGTFTGGTVSGYQFTTMRGVMIALTPNTSLEMNHFTPNGIIADYASDDVLFDEILKTVTVATP